MCPRPESSHLLVSSAASPHSMTPTTATGANSASSTSSTFSASSSSTMNNLSTSTQSLGQPLSRSPPTASGALNTQPMQTASSPPNGLLPDSRAAARPLNSSPLAGASLPPPSAAPSEPPSKETLDRRSPAINEEYFVNNSQLPSEQNSQTSYSWSGNNGSSAFLESNDYSNARFNNIAPSTYSSNGMSNPTFTASSASQAVTHSGTSASSSSAASGSSLSMSSANSGPVSSSSASTSSYLEYGYGMRTPLSVGPLVGSSPPTSVPNMFTAAAAAATQQQQQQQQQQMHHAQHSNATHSHHGQLNGPLNIQPTNPLSCLSNSLSNSNGSFSQSPKSTCGSLSSEQNALFAGAHPPTPITHGGPHLPGQTNPLDEASQASTPSSQLDELRADTPKIAGAPNGTGNFPMQTKTSALPMYSFPPTPNTIGSPGASLMSAGFYDEYETVSNATWSKTHRLDGLMKLYELSSEPARRQFLDKLIAFNEERGVSVSSCPTVNKNLIDLYRLYSVVKERGGFLQVTKLKLWKECAQLCNVTITSTTAYILRKQYIKHLLPFECRFDAGGVDPQMIVNQTENTNRKKRKCKNQPEVPNANLPNAPPPPPPQQAPPNAQAPAGSMLNQPNGLPVAMASHHMGAHAMTPGVAPHMQQRTQQRQAHLQQQHLQQQQIQQQQLQQQQLLQQQQQQQLQQHHLQQQHLQQQQLHCIPQDTNNNLFGGQKATYAGNPAPPNAYSQQAYASGYAPNGYAYSSYEYGKPMSNGYSGYSTQAPPPPQYYGAQTMYNNTAPANASASASHAPATVDLYTFEPSDSNRSMNGTNTTDPSMYAPNGTFTQIDQYSGNASTPTQPQAQPTPNGQQAQQTSGQFTMSTAAPNANVSYSTSFRPVNGTFSTSSSSFNGLSDYEKGNAMAEYGQLKTNAAASLESYDPYAYEPQEKRFHAEFK